MFCRVILAAACVLSLAGCQQTGPGENSTGGVTAPSALAMKAVDVPFSGEVSGEAAFDANPKGCAAGFTTVTSAKGPVSHMGLTSWYSEHCLNLETSEFLDAELWLTAANGDQIHGTYACNCSGGEKIGDPVICTSTLTFAGGTGRFENATGTAHMRATIIFEGFEDPAWPGRWEWKGSIRY